MQEVQQQVRGYLDGGPAGETVVERSRLCNECFKCVLDTCPQALDPMRINQLMRGLLHLEGTDPRPFTPPDETLSNERIMSALLTTVEEYGRISTPFTKGDGRYLFFAGCNVYYQPHLLLTAMDVLDRVCDDWAYLPGLDHCCGSNHDSAGRLASGRDAFKGLSDRIRDHGAETVIFWCPTCSARLSRVKAEHGVVSVSFARFVAGRLKERLVRKQVPGGMSLHQACKAGFLDLDAEAPAELLDKVSEEPMKEMRRSGRNTVCCGWGLQQHLPEAGAAQRHMRLDEAAEAGAKTLVTHCHGCQWILDAPGAQSPVDIVNYIQVAGEALGIHHPDRVRGLRQAKDVDAVMNLLQEELGEQIEQLPFASAKIREVLSATFKIS
jgi:Fe-S oxidoreductase